MEYSSLGYGKFQNYKLNPEATFDSILLEQTRRVLTEYFGLFFSPLFFVNRSTLTTK